MAPTTTKQWVITSKDKGFDGLELRDAPIPELAENEILVDIDAVSLNYRDLLIPKGLYPFPATFPRVPCSDACGTVISVGAKVTRFSIGQKVCTTLNQGHIAGPFTPAIAVTNIGGSLDGTLRQYATFPESGLVLAPATLNPIEASTLSCAPVTAWNSFYGIADRALRPGDYVLTQGTGGVSIAAVQFAIAAGAIVIATTSSAAKAEKLKKLGAHHVINYKENPNWGAQAKKLTPGGEGVNHIIEVGGPGTMKQSLDAIKFEGVISIIGFLGEGEQPGTLEALMHGCIIRGILVASRLQFEEMNRAIDANKIKPVVDDKIFEFEDAKAAYQYTWDQKHFGKTVIKVKA